jgi:hypothetical protein
MWSHFSSDHCCSCHRREDGEDAGKQREEDGADDVDDEERTEGDRPVAAAREVKIEARRPPEKLGRWRGRKGGVTAVEISMARD